MRGTLSERILAHSRETPDRLAIRLLHGQRPEQAITYGHLLEESLRYAGRLEQSGVKPGSVVLIIHPHGADLVFGFFGTLLAGAIPSILPYPTEKLDPVHYRQSMEALFQLIKPRAVLTYSGLGETLGSLLDPHHASLLLPQLGRGALGVPASMSPRDIALLQHSSGTTGLQKGVALSHTAIFNQLQSYAEAIDFSAKDVVVSWLPLYHDMGLIAGFLLPVLWGVPLVLMSPLEWVRAPQMLLQAVSRFRGTLSWLPNFAYNFCARKIHASALAGVDLSCWRAVINCSEPVSVRSHEVFLERFAPWGFRREALAASYAMAENVFAVTQGGIGEPLTIDEVDPKGLATTGRAEPASPGVRLLSSGRTLRNVEVKIVDANGDSLPSRQVGEIALRSDCMLTGYYLRPDLTEKAIRDGWYFTGDLGYRVENDLFVTGRSKDLIIVGGRNIYPADLEEIVNEVEGVHPGRVVAFGVPNAELETEDVAVVAEVDTEDEAARRQILEAIRTSIARQTDCVARHIHLVDSRWLIKTSSGKISRHANREKLLTEKGLATS